MRKGDYSPAGSSCIAEQAVVCVSWKHKGFIKEDVTTRFRLRNPLESKGKDMTVPVSCFHPFYSRPGLILPFTLYFWRRVLTWAAPRCEFIGSSRSCCCSTWSSQAISSAIASRDESFSIWSWGEAYNESSTLNLLEIPRKMAFLFLERLSHYNRITGAWTWKWALRSRGANDLSSRIYESEITFFLILSNYF